MIAAATATAALLAATLIAALFYLWAPLDDPVDVVGVPLIAGYSERTEQFSFYVFIGGVVAFAILFNRFVGRLSIQLVVTLGAVGILVALSAAAWSLRPQTLPPATLTGLIGFLVGAWCGTRPRESTGATAAIVSSSVLVWAGGFPELPLVLARHWPYLATLLLLVGIFWWQRGRRSADDLAAFARWTMRAVAVVVCAGTLIASWPHVVLALTGGAAFLLGHRSRATAGVLGALERPAWLACAAILASVVFSIDVRGEVEFWRPALAVAGGAAAAAILFRALSSPLRGPLVAARLGDVLPRAIPWVAFTAMVTVCFVKPWWGLVVTALAAVLCWLELIGARRWSSYLAFAIALLLPWGILPHGFLGALDAFHDGHVLSSVWEFESGRRLYSEVYPQWNYEFFVAWLARRLIRPNLLSYFLGIDLLAFLPIGGAVLIAFAWTRSLVWSFATGVMMAASPYLSGRIGSQFCIAGLAMIVLRSQWFCIWTCLPPIACAAALVGFDNFIAFCGAAVAAVLVGGAPGGNWRGHGERATIWRRAAWVIASLFACAAPVTLLLLVWQGWPSAVSYWSLLRSVTRAYAAYGGLPLPWSDAASRGLIIGLLVSIGLWAAFGVTAWRRMPRARRRLWSFVVVFVVLFAHRGLVRSDAVHLGALEYPILILASLGLFELLRWLRSRRVGRFFNQVRPVALSLAAVACWLTPHGGATPRQLWAFLSRARANAEPELVPSPDVIERVGEDETVWEMECAMLTYIHRRHNPTRHVLANCIVSPEEQRRAVADMTARPPRLVAWQFSGSDGIANPLRFYVISQYLFSQYRLANFGVIHFPDTQWKTASMSSDRIEFNWSFLEPAEPNWPGQDDLPAAFRGQLELGQLARRWGSDRAPNLRPRASRTHQTGEWLAAHDGNAARGPADQQRTSQAWIAQMQPASREFNYLMLDLTTARAATAPATDATCVLTFAPIGAEFDADSAIRFLVKPDGGPHMYLIPVGCSPGWSWRRGIDRLRLDVAECHSLARPKAELWRVDESRE